MCALDQRQDEGHHQLAPITYESTERSGHERCDRGGQALAKNKNRFVHRRICTHEAILIDLSGSTIQSYR
jgi:hypothetical protein